MTQIRHFTQLLTNCLGKTCKTPRTKDIRSLRVKEYIQNLFFPYTVVSARFVPKQKLSPLEILIFLKKKGGGGGKYLFSSVIFTNVQFCTNLPVTAGKALGNV